MWMIIELISKNPEISLSIRNNPEMSQRSLDVPIAANFSIYIFPGYVHLTGWYHLNYYFSIDHHSFGMSETFKKSQMSKFFDVSAGWVRGWIQNDWQVRVWESTNLKSLCSVIFVNITTVELLVNKPSIRMYILILDTRNGEQMNDVRMYIEEYLF